MSVEEEKSKLPESTSESGAEKVKNNTKKNFLDLEINKEFFEKMKEKYGDTDDSFIKGIRSDDEYSGKVKKMNDAEVLAFGKSETGIKEYYAKVINKKKEENKPTEKLAEPKKAPAVQAPEKTSDTKPEGKKENPKEVPKQENKPEAPKEESKPADKPVEKPAEPKKEPEKAPEKKPEEKKEKKSIRKKLNPKNRFSKKEKKDGKGFWKTTGDVVTYLPKQAWKATKFTAHQTANLIKYPIRTARSTVKFGRQYMDHGFSKVRREKNQGEYFSKWKWEQAKKK